MTTLLREIARPERRIQNLDGGDGSLEDSELLRPGNVADGSLRQLLDVAISGLWSSASSAFCFTWSRAAIPQPSLVGRELDMQPLLAASGLKSFASCSAAQLALPIAPKLFAKIAAATVASGTITGTFLHQPRQFPLAAFPSQ
jgi:hypothetical protein